MTPVTLTDIILSSNKTVSPFFEDTVFAYSSLVDNYRFNGFLERYVLIMHAEVNPSPCLTVVADTDKLEVDTEQVFSVTVQ